MSFYIKRFTPKYQIYSSTKPIQHLSQKKWKYPFFNFCQLTISNRGSQKKNSPIFAAEKNEIVKIEHFSRKNTRYFPQRCFDKEINNLPLWMEVFKWIHVRENWKSFKGTDRQYNEIELSIQCSGQILKDSF